MSQPEDLAAADNTNPEPAKRKSVFSPAEKMLRRLFEGMGEAVDRRFGRVVDSKTGLTINVLVDRMRAAIDEHVRDEGRKGRFAPHTLKLKFEWGTHSEAPAELIRELENELLAAAIDHINDQRYRTFAPVTIEAEADIFTSGILVTPSFGEFEEELKQQDEARRHAAAGSPTMTSALDIPVTVKITARITRPNYGAYETDLFFMPGGKRLSVGRGSDNDLRILDNSVSKIHAAITMNKESTLLVADTGSTNGTFINGRRLSYGEARQIEDGDVVGFGDVEVRLKRE